MGPSRMWGLKSGIQTAGVKSNCCTIGRSIWRNICILPTSLIHSIIIQAYINHLLYRRHCSKDFTYYNSILTTTLLIYPFYRWGNRNTERLRNMMRSHSKSGSRVHALNSSLYFLYSQNIYWGPTMCQTQWITWDIYRWTWQRPYLWEASIPV